MSIRVLAEKGLKNTAIARQLGTTEGDVRYHLKRRGVPDGRKKKPFAAEPYAGIIAGWLESRAGSKRPVNVLDLYEHLVHEHGYRRSYKSVLRFVRARYPRPPIRTYRRIETPPGAQSQTDWAEFTAVDIGDGPELLHAFVMTLSHSRRHAVVWSRSEAQLGWLHCHNESYRRLRGVAAVNRIDNVRTAISRGAGAWGVVNETYRAYARAVGFHVDACPPGQGNTKGKVEAKVRLSRLRADPRGLRFGSLAELQAWTDERVDAWARRAVCPATGLTVWESWERELEHLAEVPLLPEPFDVVVTRPVHSDCMVWFENHQYAVPFVYVGRQVEVRGCAGKVQILAEGSVVKEYPRHTQERVLIDPSCDEGESTERVLAPAPLGRLGKRLQQILEMPVECRPIDLYAALAEVA